jgi:hypothetical protein
MEVTAKQGKITGIALSYDADGNPKLNEEQSIKFWNILNNKDKLYLKEKYNLELEV